MSDQLQIDCLIVGAGIVGLAIAKEMQEYRPSWEIAVIDKMSYLGEHASGRNSGVLHAGLYYPRNSLKRKLCIEGNRLWREWACDLAIEINSCGKYILALQEEEELFLQLFSQAKDNGAQVELVATSRLREINNFSTADLAFFSTQTAVIDPSATIKKLATYVESRGVMLLLQHELQKIEVKEETFRCKINDFELESRWVVNAAGAGSIAIRQQLGLKDLELKLVKGHYLKTFTSFYNKALLYRLPEQNLKGLGIHTCIDFDGTVKFGPDTQDVMEINYALDEQHLEQMKDKVVQNFRLSREKLHGDFAGIRTKILYQENLYPDFWIKSPVPRYIELCGIESPGLTSAPAIAQLVKTKYL